MFRLVCQLLLAFKKNRFISKALVGLTSKMTKPTFLLSCNICLYVLCFAYSNDSFIRIDKVEIFSICSVWDELTEHLDICRIDAAHLSSRKIPCLTRVC